VSIAFGPQLCGTFEEAIRREWLLADGLGGYAMGTVSGLRTRRYHGLLLMDSMIGLVAVEPMLVIGDKQVRLATDEWRGGTVDPAGHELLASFDLTDGVPRWRWQVGSVVLERELAMAHGEHVVGVVHRLLAADRPVRLELTPLCTWRNVHGERYAFGTPEVENVADGFVFENAFRVAGDGWESGGDWYSGVRLREEAARGLNDTEDVFAPGMFVAVLEPGSNHELTAADVSFADRMRPATLIVANARERAAILVRRAGVTNEVDADLVRAADQFVITSNGRPTALAGYPWFGEWSRDLMTSYEGLFLTTSRWDEGRSVLRSAAETVSDGMLANTADTGTLEYNTADGTLWFLHAIGRHVAVTGDHDLAIELGPTLEAIMRHHLDGARFGIRADPSDGLLTQGAEGWALTWMDARIDGRPVTPRAGKPVEINALWIQALELAGEYAPSADIRHTCQAVATRARTSFHRRFVRPDGVGLLDVVDGPYGDDASIRPNQLLAVPLLDRRTAARVLDVCTRELLTPLGLRSLAPSDSAYRGRHRGSPAERDGAYHQGTVWPWLLGPYVDAVQAVGGTTQPILVGIDAHVGDWGLGSVSETADGDAPHAATGCPFQAWSVAEVLRVRRHDHVVPWDRPLVAAGTAWPDGGL
jgi:predicted glycogen debranching enzyme